MHSLPFSIYSLITRLVFVECIKTKIYLFTVYVFLYELHMGPMFLISTNVQEVKQLFWEKSLGSNISLSEG